MRTALLTGLSFLILAACSSTPPPTENTSGTSAAASATGGATGTSAGTTGTSTGAAANTGSTGGTSTGGATSSGGTTGPGVDPGTLWIGGEYGLGPASLTKSATNPDYTYKCPPVATLESPAQGGAEVIDSLGQLWTQFISSKNTISVWTPDELVNLCSGHPSLTFGITQSNDLGNLAFDAAGNLWASVPAGNILVGYSAADLQASGPIGPAYQLNQNPSKGIGTLFNPAGLAFDTSGTLWVANYYSILAYHTETLAAAAATGAGNPLVPPDLVLTNAQADGVVSDGGIYGQIVYQYLAFDGSGDLWVTIQNYTSGSQTNQIIEFSSAQLGNLAKNNQPKPIFTIDQPADQGSSFTGWSAIAFDAKGNLWAGAHLAAPNLYRFPAMTLNGSGTADIIITAQDDTSANLGFSLAFDPNTLPRP